VRGALAKRLKRGAITLVVAPLVAILTWVPRPLAALICKGLGVLAYALLGRARRRARARLCAGLGLPRVPERRVLAAFIAMGAALADTIALLRSDEQASRALSLDPASRDVFRAALDEGRGVVFIAAHLGSWERMAALLVEEGFPVAAVARSSTDPRLTRLYERIRRPRGVRSIYRGTPGASVAIARELARGRAVGFLVDLPSRVPCARAILFGEEADVPAGPARIALVRRAAVVVGTCAPRAPRALVHGYSTESGPLLGASPSVIITRVRSDDLAPGPAGESELIFRLSRALESRIAAWPEAWLGLFVSPRLRGADVPR
jgi:KDO2-lipid IV(A) lauroyltransferase